MSVASGTPPNATARHTDSINVSEDMNDPDSFGGRQRDAAGIVPARAAEVVHCGRSDTIGCGRAQQGLADREKAQKRGKRSAGPNLLKSLQPRGKSQGYERLFRQVCPGGLTMNQSLRRHHSVRGMLRDSRTDRATWLSDADRSIPPPPAAIRATSAAPRASSPAPAAGCVSTAASPCGRARSSMCPTPACASPSIRRCGCRTTSSSCCRRAARAAAAHVKWRNATQIGAQFV